MIDIKNRYTGEVIISGEYESVKECLEKNTGADLRDASLTCADLTGADLRDASLTDADLTGADLRCADLTDASLTGADLRGADLRCADLTDASLTCADLRGAKFLGSNSSEFKTKTIHQFSGLYYHVFFYDTHMKIGCECHSYDDWWKFDDKRILEMDGKSALNFWRKNKDMLMNIARGLND